MIAVVLQLLVVLLHFLQLLLHLLCGVQNIYFGQSGSNRGLDAIIANHRLKLLLNVLLSLRGW